MAPMTIVASPHTGFYGVVVGEIRRHGAGDDEKAMTPKWDDLQNGAADGDRHGEAEAWHLAGNSGSRR